MTKYLDEEMIGADETIGFPKLKLCMGLVALIDNASKKNLVGIHLTNIERNSIAIPIFKKHMLPANLLEKIVALYGCCNRSERYGAVYDSLGTWKAEMQQIATMIGYKGLVRGFDTGIIGPRNEGTYVEYRASNTGGRSVRIFYKQDDRMTYETGGQGQMIQKGANRTIPIDAPNYDALVAAYAVKNKDHVASTDAKISATVNRKHAFGEKSLNEVDYSLRLDEVFVA